MSYRVNWNPTTLLLIAGMAAAVLLVFGVAVYFRRSAPEKVQQTWESSVRAQLREWDTQLRDLETRRQSFETSARDKIDRAIADIRKNRDQLQLQLAEGRKATGKAWDEFKRRSERALDDIRAKVKALKNTH